MRVIGIGDNVVDRYANERIMFPGGNAVNFAVYAKQCGEESAYLGLLADDVEGRLIRSSLSELGVDVSRSPLREGMTTERCDVKLVKGDRTFIGNFYGDGFWAPLKLDDAQVDYLKGFDLIHTACYGDMADEMQKLSACKGVKTYDFSEEPEYRTDRYLETVCPHIDIALFSGASMSKKERLLIRDKAIWFGADLVLITDGAKGQILWDGNREYQGQVKFVEAVDTLGAGDSFFASFVIELMRQGYVRGELPREEGVNKAFAYAADFSAKTCLVDGAFGFGTEY